MFLCRANEHQAARGSDRSADIGHAHRDRQESRQCQRSAIAGGAETAGPDQLSGFEIDCAHHAIGRLLTRRSEEHTSELQSLMFISYAGFFFKKKKSYTTIKTYKPNHSIQSGLKRC